MKKVKYLLPIILLFITINVKAIDKCTTEEMNRLNELAKNVQFKTDYEVTPMETTNDKGEKIINDIDVSYKIQIINDNEDLKYYYKLSSEKEKKQVSASELSNISFPDGEKLEISIYSYTTNLCTDELLKTEKIDLPAYNTYYYLNKDKCKNNPNFKYCKEFMDINISFEDIEKEYDKYLSDNAIKKTSSFIKDNIIYIIGGVVILGFAVYFVTVSTKKRKKKLDI